jgi:hypothetical protein
VGFKAITVTIEQKHKGNTHFKVSSLFIFRKYCMKTCTTFMLVYSCAENRSSESFISFLCIRLL